MAFFNVETDIDPVADIIRVDPENDFNPPLRTGFELFYSPSPGGTATFGLDAFSVYFCEVVEGGVALYLTRREALDGIGRIDLTEAQNISPDEGEHALVRNIRDVLGLGLLVLFTQVPALEVQPVGDPTPPPTVDLETLIIISSVPELSVSPLNILTLEPLVTRSVLEELLVGEPVTLGPEDFVTEVVDVHLEAVVDV